MLNEYVMLLDKWGRIFKRNQELIQKEILNSGIFKYQTTKHHFVVGDSKTLFVNCYVTALMNGVFSFEMHGKFHGTDDYFTCQFVGHMVELEEQLVVKKKKECVTIIVKDEVNTSLPIHHISKTIQSVMVVSFKESRKMYNLSNSLLEELFDIQSKVMEKEKDTEGLQSLLEEFRVFSSNHALNEG